MITTLLYFTYFTVGPTSNWRWGVGVLGAFNGEKPERKRQEVYEVSAVGLPV